MASSRRGGIKQTGTGRILFWRGGSVWIGRAEESTDFHSHHAIQITLALSDDDALRFRSPGEDWQQYATAIVPAHHSHAFAARGELVALVFVEPESREGQALRERFCKGIASLSDESILPDIAALTAAHHEKCADQHLIACARAVISRLAATSPTPSLCLDKRILRAIELLHARLGQAISLADVAAAVHLSPERFRHLFIEQTGIRFRPYVLWLRLGSAIASYAAGASLTEASYAGGFADSAHLSRTFKRMFGVVPVSIEPE
jgi:AraC family transcriptional regulator